MFSTEDSVAKGYELRKRTEKTEERSRRVCSLALSPGYAVLFASLGALMVNPYGWRLVWNPIDMMLYQKLNIANGDEWQPLRLDWFAGRAALITIGLMVLANCLRGRKWKFTSLLLFSSPGTPPSTTLASPFW
jgi:hypothetical protein